MRKAEIDALERLLGFKVEDYRDLFDFVSTLRAKRSRTPSLNAVLDYRGTRECMIAYPGQWRSSRGTIHSCSGVAEVVDHAIPLSSNRIRKLVGVRAQPGRKIATQGIGSAHLSNLIGACRACNARKLQTLEGDLIRRVLAITAGRVAIRAAQPGDAAARRMNGRTLRKRRSAPAADRPRR